jgi:hypothetical protein
MREAITAEETMIMALGITDDGSLETKVSEAGSSPQA